jgi:hypothetical protein
LPTDELFEFSDAELIAAGVLVVLKESVQAFEDSSLPVANELGFDVVLAAEFSLASSAGEEIKDHLRLELGSEGSTGAWHRKDSLRRPVKTRLLVQR